MMLVIIFEQNFLFAIGIANNNAGFSLTNHLLSLLLLSKRQKMGCPSLLLISYFVFNASIVKIFDTSQISLILASSSFPIDAAKYVLTPTP